VQPTFTRNDLEGRLGKEENLAQLSTALVKKRDSEKKIRVDVID